MILQRAAAAALKQSKPATRPRPKSPQPRIPLFWSTEAWPCSSVGRYRTFVAFLLRHVGRTELWAPDRMSWWFPAIRRARADWRLGPIELCHAPRGAL